MREPLGREAALPLHYGKHIFSTAGINLYSNVLDKIPWTADVKGMQVTSAR